MFVGALIPLRASTRSVVSARNLGLFLGRPCVRLRRWGTSALGLPFTSAFAVRRLHETRWLRELAEFVLVLALVTEGALSSLELVAQAFSLAVVEDRRARWCGRCARRF